MKQDITIGEKYKPVWETRCTRGCTCGKWEKQNEQASPVTPIAAESCRGCEYGVCPKHPVATADSPFFNIGDLRSRLASQQAESMQLREKLRTAEAELVDTRFYSGEIEIETLRASLDAATVRAEREAQANMALTSIKCTDTATISALEAERDKWKRRHDAAEDRAEKAEAELSRWESAAEALEKAAVARVDEAVGRAEKTEAELARVRGEAESLRVVEVEYKLLMRALRSWADSTKTMPANEFAAWLLREKLPKDPDR